MAKVTKDTMIGELLQIDENVAPMLLNIGMHCLGCPSSQMETIAEAAMVHGIDPDDLVNDINDFIEHDATTCSACGRVILFPCSAKYAPTAGL